MTTLNLNLGRIMFQTQGQYSNTTSYVVDDIVYLNGQTYICVQNNTGVSPLIGTDYTTRVNTNYWNIMSDGFNYRGTWANNTIYYPGDIVTAANTTSVPQFGGQQGSYICKKRHTSSLKYRDLWVNPGNEWEELLKSAGSTKLNNQTKMLSNRGPINWYGHPFIPSPTWTNGQWQGNLAWNIPSYAKRWEWNNAFTPCNTVYNTPFVDKTGFPGFIGQGAQYNTGWDNGNFQTARLLDVGTQRDYYNNLNPTGGYKGADYRKDNSAGLPTVVQDLWTYQSHWSLWSNGTLTLNGYSQGAGQGAQGSAADVRPNGAQYIPFPPGTFIVKFAHSCQGTQQENGHLMALDSEGFVWTWGYNGYGQLGNGSEPAQGKNIGQSQAGNTVDGWNPARLPKFAFNGARVVDIWAVGSNYGSSYALDEFGVLWAWGYNGYGALGYPTASGFQAANYSAVPFQVGRNLNSGAGINWNTYGGIQRVAFGQPGTTTSTQCMYILDGQGYLWWCGYANSLQVGDNATTGSTGTSGSIVRLNYPSVYNLNGNMINIWVTGGDNSGYNCFVLRNDGVLFGWGTNGNYQLTDGTTTARNYPVPIQGASNTYGGPIYVTGTNSTSSLANMALQYDSANTRYRIVGGGYNAYGPLGQGESTSNHVTGGANGGGATHRIFGSSLYAWQPATIPAGIGGARIRDIQMGGTTSVPQTYVHMENGQMYSMGNATSNAISWYSPASYIIASMGVKPHGMY